MGSEPEKNREVFDEDALDFEPEEEEEDVVSLPVEDAAEVSITVAELLEASENKEDVTGDTIKDVTEEVAKSDADTIKEVARDEAIISEEVVENEANVSEGVTKDEAITADEKAAAEAAIKAAEESNKDLFSFR